MWDELKYNNYLHVIRRIKYQTCLKCNKYAKQNYTRERRCHAHWMLCDISLIAVWKLYCAGMQFYMHSPFLSTRCKYSDHVISCAKFGATQYFFTVE